jgi:signal peptidase I
LSTEHPEPPSPAPRGDEPSGTAPETPPAADSVPPPTADVSDGSAGAAASAPGTSSGDSAGAGTATATTPASSRTSKPRKRGSFARELPFLILIAFLLALLIKAFLVQAFYIPSGSMERTLLIGDRVLVNKLVYRVRSVHRGEIVVFNGKGTGFENAVEIEVPGPSNGFERVIRDVQKLLGLGAPGEKDFIKRVIGVGGDTVNCCDAQGRVTVNGKPLNEPYIYENSPQTKDDPNRGFHGPVHVPKGQLFVMGDHRGDSSDSRINGTIPESKVIGRAFIRVWPVSRIGLLHVPKTFSNVAGTAFMAVPTLPPVEAAAVVVPVAFLGRRRRRRRRERQHLTAS